MWKGSEAGGNPPAQRAQRAIGTQRKSSHRDRRGKEVQRGKVLTEALRHREKKEKKKKFIEKYRLDSIFL